MPANPSKKRRKFWLSFFTMTVLSIIVALVIWVGGRVEGREFTPTHFTQRSFSFWEVPLLGLQVTPIKRSPVPMRTINLLRSKPYFPTPKSAPTVFHPVEISRGLSGQPQPGDAKILVDYLTLDDDGTSVWEQWTRDHPQAAAVFWPVIHKLAQRELYLLMPDLFAIAERTTDANALSSQIDTQLRSEYLALAQDLAAAEQNAMAVEVLEEAVADYPGDQALRDLRAELKQSATSQ